MLPLLNAIQLDYRGALSPTLTAALAMMDDSALRMTEVFGNTNVTLVFTAAVDAVVDLADTDIYESGSPGDLLSGVDVIITRGMRRFYLRLGGSDSLRYFEHTGISVDFAIGITPYDLVDDSRYTGASFADLVFAYGAGIVDQRFNLSFLNGARRVLLEYDRDGLNFCSVTPGTPSCGSPRVAAINAGFEEYPQGAIPINTDGLNRPLIVLRDDSDGYSETINLANNLYYVSNGGQYSRLRNGFPVTVSADGGVHQFEIAPVPGSGGRHIVRPLRPTFPFVYDRDALRFDGINFFSQGRAVGRVSLAVDLFADSTYNPDASTHSAGRSGIYRRLYDRQQSNNGSDLIAVLASVARADTGLTVVTRLRTRGVSRGRAGVTRLNFCPPLEDV